MVVEDIGDEKPMKIETKLGAHTGQTGQETFVHYVSNYITLSVRESTQMGKAPSNPPKKERYKRMHT